MTVPFYLARYNINTSSIFMSTEGLRVKKTFAEFKVENHTNNYSATCFILAIVQGIHVEV